MFKKFKDRLNEVTEDVKKDPRFQNSLASVNKFTQETLSTLNRDKSGSRESLQSNASQQSQDKFGGGAANFEHPSSGAAGSNNNLMNNDQFFSLGDDDESLMTPPIHSTPTRGFESVELAHPLTSSGRGRRSSSGSTTTDSSTLFPIYEAPQQVYSLPSDLDSTAGSEWEDGSSAQLSAISKEQLFQMLQKMRTRYHKYKGRYVDVAKAYTDLENENKKVKNIMQQTQDKALRRISELREQCQLEQKAKRHLEEELRSDMEEKEHVIQVLQTKVSLLKSREQGVIDSDQTITGDTEVNGDTLIDLGSSEADGDGKATEDRKESKKVAALEEKIRRLEALLNKCKESIKANKQKTQALTEVKESLSVQLSERDEDCERLKFRVKEFEAWKKKAQEEELQIAETKMVMHQEIITKDEEVGTMRTNLKKTTEELEKQKKEVTSLKEEIDHLKKSRESVEQSLESEKASALQEMSRGKTSAL